MCVQITVNTNYRERARLYRKMSAYTHVAEKYRQRLCIFSVCLPTYKALVLPRFPNVLLTCFVNMCELYITRAAISFFIYMYPLVSLPIGSVVGFLSKWYSQDRGDKPEAIKSTATLGTWRSRLYSDTFIHSPLALRPIKPQNP